MVLAAFFFATMGVGIKIASASFNTFELVFYRGLVSVLFMAIVMLSRGRSLRTPVPMMHATTVALCTSRPAPLSTTISIQTPFVGIVTAEGMLSRGEP